MKILSVLAFALPCRALIALDCMGTVKFCAVYRNQDSIGNVLKRFHSTGVLCQQVRYQVKGVVECVVGNAVKQVADVVVGGNALHAVQRLTVVATGLLLENSLVLQKRRRLDMEHGKRRHWHVAKAKLGVCAVARIRQGAENLLQLIEQCVEYETHSASYSTNGLKI